MDALNNQQRQAIEATPGPVLIIAGPGTGKTKTLTARIAHLVKSTHADAKDVLALTFTVKAAREMKDRVAQLISDAPLPNISTFHGLAYELLQAYYPSKEFHFVSEPERFKLIHALPRSPTLKGVALRELALRISRFKGALRPADSDVAELVRAYNEALSSRELIDFDDLLLGAYQLLREGKPFRAAFRRHYTHILIDEFQDTSELQWEIAKLLLDGDSIFIIGDPNQSIYSFRGAGTDTFDLFEADFPNHRKVTLRTNYRSARSVVALTNAIFPQSLPLTAHITDEGYVQAMVTLNEYSEADLVLRTIEQGIGGSDLLKASVDTRGQRFRDFAILYRTHHIARVVQQRLQDSGIPYQIVGEGSPYERPEVRAVLDMLIWLQHGEVLPQLNGLRETQVTMLAKGLDKNQPVSKLAHDIIQVFKLANDSQTPQRHLDQLISTIVRFDAAHDSLAVCVDYFEQLAQSDFYDQTADVVTMLTIHAAKGLEFTHVMLIAAEQGSLPLIRKTGQANIEEEKRLFYVAVSRAKEQLDLIYTQKRAGEARRPSQFISELDDQILPRRSDPELQQQQKHLHKRQQKARQGTLF